MGLPKSAIWEMMFSALLGRQVGRRHQLGRGGAAVDAAQIAALGNFPEDQARLVFFLARRMSAAVACVMSFPPRPWELRLISMPSR